MSVSSNPSETTGTLSNITVEFTAEEKKRLKKYPGDDLNITNMVLNGSTANYPTPKRENPPCYNRIEPEGSKKPLVLQTFKIPSIKLNEEATNESPPIKLASLQDHKQAVEEFMDIVLGETPTKNLSLQMYTKGKHSITPLQNLPPAKIVFSSSKSSWLNRPLLPTPPKATRSSSGILGSLGLSLNSPFSERKFGKKVSMELEAFSEPIRKTQHQEEAIDETLLNPIQVSDLNEKTIYEDSIAEEPVQDPAQDPAVNTAEDIQQTAKSIAEEEAVKVPAVFGKGNRQTVFEQDIDEEKLSAMKVNPVKIQRLTIYEDSMLIEEPTAGSSKASFKSARKTLFESSLDETNNAISDPSQHERTIFKTIIETTSPVAADVSGCFGIRSDSPMELETTQAVARKTEYQEEDIDETWARLKPEVAPNSRQTIYGGTIAIDETTATTSTNEKGIRKTLFDSLIEETCPKIHSEKTFFDLDPEETVAGPKSMTLVKLSEISRASLAARSSKHCQTIFNSDISLTFNTYNQFVDQKSTSELVNGTQFNDIEILETTSELAEKAERLLKNPIATTASTSNLFTKTFQNELIVDATKDDIVESELEEHSSIISLARDAQVGADSMDISLQRRTTLNHSNIQFEASYRLSKAAPQLSDLDMSQPFMSPGIVPPPPEFKSPMVPTVEQPKIDTPKVDKIPLSRKSVITQSSAVKASLKGNFQAHQRQTICEEVNMEIDEPRSAVPSTSSNQTFTLKKRDSMKLMNVTDADIDSFLEDESNPCVNESSMGSREQDMQISYIGNVTSSNQALQDFVNITIQNTSLDLTNNCNTPDLGDFKARDFNTPADLSVRIDNFVGNLEQKARPKPRMEIDEFFENLNIKPVKLKRCPDLNVFGNLLYEAREKSKKIVAEAQAEAKKKYANPELSLQRKLER